jgi:hypothetical protein
LLYAAQISFLQAACIRFWVGSGPELYYVDRKNLSVRQTFLDRVTQTCTDGSSKKLSGMHQVVLSSA